MERVFVVQREHYDYDGDSRRPSWNSAGDPVYVKDEEAQVAAHIAELNVKYVNSFVFEKMHELGHVKLTQADYLKKIEARDSLTQVQRETLGLEKFVTGWNSFESSVTALDKKIEELLKVIEDIKVGGIHIGMYRYTYEALEITALEDI